MLEIETEQVGESQAGCHLHPLRGLEQVDQGGVTARTHRGRDGIFPRPLELIMRQPILRPFNFPALQEPVS